MARRKKKKPRARTTSYTIVGDQRGAPRERAFPLAAQAAEAAEAGQCGAARTFLGLAKQLGGGPVTAHAARVVAACRRYR